MKNDDTQDQDRDNDPHKTLHTALGRTLGFFAHDLRGPLGTLRQVVDVLRDDEDVGLTPDELYEMMDQSIQAANQIIDDCVEFGRGNPKLVVVSGTCDQLLRPRIDRLRREIEELGVEFEWDIDESCRLHLDARSIAHVLASLCKHASEAIKRQPNARVTVGVRSDDSSQTLWVADNGPALSPESLEQLFQPFTAKGSALTGLALPIAKQIVDAHGGSLSVVSGDGGTRYNIELPLLEPSSVPSPRRDKPDC